MPEIDKSMNLHVGEWVEVRSATEILATLDDSQSVAGLPFMPEMLQYCGRRFRVFKSAHKTADTSEFFTIRRMASAVHLENLRCDGAAHGGCQAACLLFWKEGWLKRVPEEQAVAMPVEGNSGKSHEADSLAAGELLELASKCPAAAGEPECFRCQATEMLRATTKVRRRGRWNPLFYVRDLSSGNVKLVDFIRFGALAMLNAFLLRWFNFRLPRVHGLAGDKTPSCELNLQPGELVRVRSRLEIQQTLNRELRNRGMWFDVEMFVYCGRGAFRVHSRVERIVNEKTGQLMKLPNPCIILEGVTCSGNYLVHRMFSPRNEYPFWREIWLERAPGADSSRQQGTILASPN